MATTPCTAIGQNKWQQKCSDFFAQLHPHQLKQYLTTRWQTFRAKTKADTSYWFLRDRTQSGPLDRWELICSPIGSASIAACNFARQKVWKKDPLNRAFRLPLNIAEWAIPITAVNMAAARQANLALTNERNKKTPGAEYIIRAKEMGKTEASLLYFVPDPHRAGRILQNHQKHLAHWLRTNLMAEAIDRFRESVGPKRALQLHRNLTRLTESNPQASAVDLVNSLQKQNEWRKVNGIQLFAAVESWSQLSDRQVFAEHWQETAAVQNEYRQILQSARHKLPRIQELQRQGILKNDQEAAKYSAILLQTLLQTGLQNSTPGAVKVNLRNRLQSDQEFTKKPTWQKTLLLLGYEPIVATGTDTTLTSEFTSLLRKKSSSHAILARELLQTAWYTDSVRPIDAFYLPLQIQQQSTEKRIAQKRARLQRMPDFPPEKRYLSERTDLPTLAQKLKVESIAGKSRIVEGELERLLEIQQNWRFQEVRKAWQDDKIGDVQAMFIHQQMQGRQNELNEILRRNLVRQPAQTGGQPEVLHIRFRRKDRCQLLAKIKNDQIQSWLALERYFYANLTRAMGQCLDKETSQRHALIAEDCAKQLFRTDFSDSAWLACQSDERLPLNLRQKISQCQPVIMQNKTRFQHCSHAVLDNAAHFELLSEQLPNLTEFRKAQRLFLRQLREQVLPKCETALPPSLACPN